MIPEKKSNCVSLCEHDCEVYICVVIRKEAQWMNENKRHSGERIVEKNAQEDNRIGWMKKKIPVPQISNEYIRTLGISTLIKMFDLYSFFISFCFSVISFLPTFSLHFACCRIPSHLPHSHCGRRREELFRLLCSRLFWMWFYNSFLWTLFAEH